MGKQQRNCKGQKKRLGAAALGVCLVLLVALIGAAIARYQRAFRSEGSVRAQEFYFTSDFLDGGTHTLAPGSTSVTFTLGNHADELRFSEMDITYEVTVNNGATVEQPNGTLAKNTKADAAITISNLQAGTYTVTAVGTGGYSKTLTATIVVPAETAQLYQHQDSVPGEYLLLTVWNEGDKPGTVTVTYTGIPDNTNPNMTDWRTNSTQTVTLEPHTSKVFRFFGGTVTVKDAESNEVETKIPD